MTEYNIMTAPPPGKIAQDDAIELGKLCAGKEVLQVGGYCGKASAVIGCVCKSLLVVEDFCGYKAPMGVCMQEFMRSCSAYDAQISWKRKNPEELDPDEVGLYDVVYIDADRDAEDLKADKQMGMGLLVEGGVLVWHDEQGKLKTGLAATWTFTRLGEPEPAQAS